ncbi:MAG: PQQ-binding-like beta-propeller repeat protein [Deltaproteobacteria bacterium]|jgi:outer membrane protein assembly factor BamB
MRSRLAFVAGTLLLVACESDPLYERQLPRDGGVVFVRDGGPAITPDAGTPDAGTPDSGEPPVAMEPVYIHTGQTLFAYDPATNTTSQIGDFFVTSGQLEDMVDIAIDSQGRLFGGTRQAGSQADANRIYQIDPETAECRYRFSYDDTLHGLTFLPDGRLVIAGERVSVVDPISGSQLVEFPAANAYQTSGDIVGLPDGNLYWTVRGERRMDGSYENDSVVRIDPSTGNISWLGEAAVTRIYGLGYANGQLFGFSSMGVVVTIQPENGVVVRQAPLAGRWFGATTNPVLWE